MERAVSGLFKGVFGVVIVLCGAMVVLSILAMNSIGGSISPGILIPLALIVWILLRRRNSATKNAVTNDAAIGVAPSQVGVGDTLEGVGATIEIRSAGLAIARQGAASFFVHGVKGEKLLPFKSITAVQFKEPGRSMSGYIQFSLAGAIESNRGIWDASKDENTVLFTKEYLSQFLGLRKLIEHRLGDDANAPAPSRQSRAQELATLVALYDAGHLSAEEFGAEKAKILSS